MRFAIGGVCLLLGVLAAFSPQTAGQPDRRRDNSLWRQASFQDFRAGTLEDGGANTYISARGAVELVNRWDYNNDGNIDLLFVGNHDHSENLDAWLYPGKGGPRIPIPANGGRWALIEDLNHDGMADIVIANRDNGTIGDLDSFVYWGSKEGYRSDNRTELPTIFSGRPAAADLNHDGYVDLVFPNGGTVLLHPGDEVFHRGSFIYWGGPDGYRKDRMTELPTNNAVAAAVADLDGDGWPDIIFANTSDGQDRSRFLLGDEEDRAGRDIVAQSFVYWGGPSGFSAERRSDLGTQQAITLRTYDVDGDGLPDPVFLDRRGVVVYRNLGGRQFSPTVIPSTAGTQDFAMGDLNRDGRLDLVLARGDGHILFGNGNLTFGKELILPGKAAGSCEIADIDGNGYPDVILTNHDDGAVFETGSYVYWNGPGGFDVARRKEFPTSGAQSVAVGDTDGDGKPDLLFLNGRGGHVKRVPTYILSGKRKRPVLDRSPPSRHRDRRRERRRVRPISTMTATPT